MEDGRYGRDGAILSGTSRRLEGEVLLYEQPLMSVRSVAGSFDSTVRIWDCKSQSTKPIQVFEEARDSVSSVLVAGHEIIAGSVDGRVRIYDLRMGMVYVDVVGRESFTPTPPPSLPDPLSSSIHSL